MAKSELHKKEARLDLRLSTVQKDCFEKAARTGGFRNLTAFVLNATQEKAEKIMAEKEQVIASQEDKVTFFDEVTMPQEPNRALVDATKEYEYLFSE